ncbi:MAG: hypothetical protein MUD10_02850 [Candidatus Pacebacteria bacterium]|nr:hypothetical protein [Candidatus Paceibacterota bacterium]
MRNFVGAALTLLTVVCALSTLGIAVDYKIPLSTGEVFRFSLPADANITTSLYDLGIAQMTSMVEVVEVGGAVSLVETPLTGKIYKATVAMGLFNDSTGATAIVEILRFDPVSPEAAVTERACLYKLVSMTQDQVDYGVTKGKFAGVEADIHTVYNPLSGKDNAGMVSIRINNNTTINVLADQPWFESLRTSLRGGSLPGAS